MGFQKKVGKGRLDKYYHLAKEQGYRARSAFKLIQLNKKYNFLANARCLVDLCAAPGGWCQVATKYMPTPSLIIGIDLAPIKPLPGVITFQQDITTEKCRAQLRDELKTWKVDVFLHDGAPNVGTAWVQDAYTQSELVLMSLKLAVEFLNKGGSFVTKVFRSKDYNNLLWVFQQLFKRVEATKPPSSRNISAEIFVVCRDFIAPKKIDPKFLDPKHVFKELDLDSGGKQARLVDIFHPEKVNRQREGYEEGDYILHKTLPIMDFMRTDDPINILSDVHQLTMKPSGDDAFPNDKQDIALLLKHPSTEMDVKECCADLKVLGKKDFKMLLRWRLAIRKFLGIEARDAAKKKAEEDAKKAEEEEEEREEKAKVNPDDEIVDEIERLEKEEERKTRKQKKKVAEERKKNLTRMQLNMQAPTEIGLEQDQGRGEDSLFGISGKKDRSTGELAILHAPAKIAGVDTEGAYDDVALETERDLERMNDKNYLAGFSGEESDGEEDEGKADAALERELDSMYSKYKREWAERRDKKIKAAAEAEAAGKADWKDEPEFTAFADQTRDADSSDSSDEETDDEGRAPARSRASGFDGRTNEGESDEEDIAEMKAAHLAKSKGKKGGKKEEGKPAVSASTRMFFDQDLFADVSDEEDAEEEEEDVEMEEADDAAATGSKRKAADEDIDMDQIMADGGEWDVEGTKAAERVEESKKDLSLVTAEAMTMAQALVNRKKSKSSLIDEGFNRYAFHDDPGLPNWFLDDEGRNNKPTLPTTKEAALAIKEREKAVNARPIKKVAEAKARKKMRTAQRAEKIAKKQQDIVGNAEMTEKEKAESIEKIAKKMGAKQVGKKREIKVVVAKGINRAQKGRPKGVKGRYKMVDGRMKKEVRALKRIAKKSGPKRRK